MRQWRRSSRSCNVVLTMLALPRKWMHHRASLQKLKDSFQGDSYPVGPIVELIAQLVQRLFQQVRLKQYAQLSEIRRQETGWLGAIPVRSHKGGRCPGVPE